MEFSSFPRLAIHGVGCHLVTPGSGDKLSPPPGQPRDQDGKQPIRLTIPLYTLRFSTLGTGVSKLHEIFNSIVYWLLKLIVNAVRLRRIQWGKFRVCLLTGGSF